MAKRIKKVPFPHVTLRKSNQSFLYRRVVPPNLRDKIRKEDGSPRADWVRTWPAGTSAAIVEREAFKLSDTHDREILAAKGDKRQGEIADAEASARDWLSRDPADLAFFLTLLADSDTALTPQIEAVRQAIAGGGKHPGDSPLLSVALAQDIERYGGERDNYPVTSSVESFIAACGDSPVTTISRRSAQDWIASLKNKSYAPATLRKRVGNLRSLINRTFLDLEYAGLNPFAKHQLKGNGSVTDRLPFNKAMLGKIDSYLAKSTRLKPETRHILQVMRNTGASPKEVGGLVLSDISLKGTVPYLWIRINAQRGIKAEARDRQIPLVGVSLKAMKDAVAQAMERTKGESPDTAKLFAGFGGKTGSDAKLISKNVNKAVHAAGIKKSKRLSAYSLRHTFAEAMRSAGVLNHTQDRLLGHTVPGIAGKYGSPRARLAEAKAAIEKAMEHLGDIDPSVYSEAERIK